MFLPSSIPVPLQDLVAARDPLRLVLRKGRLSFGHWMLVLLGTASMCLLVVALVGWLGALEIARNGWGVAGTAAALFFWVLPWSYGLRPRWMRVELIFEADRLVADSRMLWWQTRNELLHSWAESAAVVPSFGASVGVTSDMTPCLVVTAERPCSPLRIARGMNLDRQTLDLLKVLIDEWRSGARRGLPAGRNGQRPLARHRAVRGRNCCVFHRRQPLARPDRSRWNQDRLVPRRADWNRNAGLRTR